MSEIEIDREIDNQLLKKYWGVELFSRETPPETKITDSLIVKIALLIMPQWAEWVVFGDRAFFYSHAKPILNEAGAMTTGPGPGLNRVPMPRPFYNIVKPGTIIRRRNEINTW